ncbi:DNA cytosine methyltransferase, partial [Thalassorhabdus alkalitolerans]
KKKDWDIIRNSFQELGYEIHFRILDAADYGVPQHRERLIMVGVKNNYVDFKFPRPIYGPDSLSKQSYVTAGDAIKDIDDPNEEVPEYGGKYGKLIEEVPPGMNYLHFTEKMGHPEPKFAWRSRFSNFLYKADPSNPIKTLVASQGRYGGPFHWKGRKFSINELKRLQSFPDAYHIEGSWNHASKQIGNSVPPKLAEAIAQSIMHQLFDSNKFKNIDLLNKDDHLSFDKRKGEKAKRTRKKTKENAGVEQLNLFNMNDVSDPFDNVKHSFNLEWYYSTVRKQTNQYLQSNYGHFNVIGTLNNGIYELQVKKNKSQDVSLILNLDFHKPIAKKFVKIKCTLSSDTLWDVPIAWDAINYAIKETTSYDSIEPLYGHFTEPYPMFDLSIETNGIYEKDMAEFLQKISNFSNLKKLHPVNEIRKIFGTNNHLDVIKKLLMHGFDIRVHQTNKTIPLDFYKCCYPFTTSLDSLKFIKWIDIENQRKVN